MTEVQATYGVSPNKEIKGHIDNLSGKENIMPELTIISTCYRVADKPVVQIGMSEYPQGKKQVITGPELTSKAEIDNQIDDLIRQLEAARIDAKKFFVSGTP